MKKNGFTLLEVLVAIGLLSVLLVIMSGLFSRFITAQRRDITEVQMQEDVRSAVEFMSREIATGYGSTYASDRTSAHPEATLVLRNQNGQCVEYRAVDGVLQRATASADPGRACDDGVIFGAYTALTGTQTTIGTTFIPPQGSTTLSRQGFVTVVIHAISATNAAAAPLDMETTITSRQIQAYE